MVRSRTVAFCMAILTIFFVIACIPVSDADAKAMPCTENPLPLSLAAPAERMYFLPPYDEVASFSPVKRLYDLPVSFETCEVRMVLNSSADYEVSGQASDLCCIESISPRAP